MAEHTPGPWHTSTLNSRWIITNQAGTLIATVHTTMQDARLIAEACNSYRAHCGPRAVECAEGDLLGEALEALKDCTEELFQLHEQTHPECVADRPRRCPSRAALEQARAVLAKAAPEPATEGN